MHAIEYRGQIPGACELGAKDPRDTSCAVPAGPTSKTIGLLEGVFTASS